MERLDVALKVGAIDKRFEIAAPSIFCVQTFPVCAQWGKYIFIPYDLTIQEEVKINSATL